MQPDLSSDERRRELLTKCNRFSELARTAGYEVKSASEFDYPDRTVRYRRERVYVVNKVGLTGPLDSCEVQDELTRLAKRAVRGPNGPVFQLTISSGNWMIEFCNGVCAPRLGRG